MIPQKIQIKNFLSYGAQTQTINFAPYHLICLSGKNGHGKSALLDAITWSVWGCARKVSNVSKADQGLLRLGETNMSVTFDFIANNIAYRIKREFTLAYGKAYTQLEFGTIKTENNFIPLTDKTLRATQKKIEQTIGLDYATFINTAFLRQGNSDEFSKRSPKDRKEIIATILDLAQYDAIKKRSLEHAKQANNEKQTLITLCEKITNEVSKKEELQKLLTLTIQTLTNITIHEKNHIKCKELLQKKIAILQKYQLEKIKLNEQKSHQQKTFDEGLTELRTSRIKWRTIHKKIRTLPKSNNLIKQKKELISQIKMSQQQIQNELTLKNILLEKKELLHNQEQQLVKKQNEQTHNEQKLLHTINAEHHTTTLEHKRIRDELHTVLATIEQNNIKNKKSSTELQILQKKCNNIEIITKQFEKRKEYYQRYIAQRNVIINELKKSFDKQQVMHDLSNPSCPLCEQIISAQRKRFLQKKCNQQNELMQHKHKRFNHILPKLKELLIKQYEQIQILNESHKKIQQLKQISADITKQTKELTTISKILLKQKEVISKQLISKEKVINAQAKNITKLTKQFEEQRYAQTKNLCNEIEKLQKEIASCGNTQQQMIRQSKELDSIDKQLEELQNLQQEKNKQDDRKILVSKLCMSLKKQKLTFISLDKKITEIQSAIATIDKKITDDYQTLKNKKNKTTKEKEQALEEKGKLTNALQKIETLNKEYADYKEQIKQLSTVINDYLIIASATSKDGIQGLLIEDAIPEIEHEANALLTKLTDNQAHIFIEPMRDLKNGGTKETLDINISDNMGIRPYELFSGGEAFRIDFCLRIAISKLLARRAGTSLQTLIIDEGFGSQDEQGLSHIMETIYKIQNDFEKVIIVSHLPQMKHQFPVHFFVEKLPYGSHVHVLHQG
jgi:exonuclease SbcC